MSKKNIDKKLFLRWIFVQKWKAAEKKDKEALKALCCSSEEVDSFLDAANFSKNNAKKIQEENNKRMVSLDLAFSKVSS